MSGDPRREARRLRQLIGAHAVLAGLWVAWRMVESTPGLRSAWGGTFASSTPGRAATLLTLLLGMTCLAAVVALTVPRWRDLRAGALFAALAAALVQRERVDVFDLVYVGLVAMVGVGSIRGRPRAA